MDIFDGPLDSPDFSEITWDASEVVHELDDRPHLLLRIRLEGRAFPQLDAQPFVRVLGRRASAESWFARVAEDQTSLSGYFAVDGLRSAGMIEWGYGSSVWGRLAGRFDPRATRRLDRSRLPQDLVLATERFIQRKKAGRLPPRIHMPKSRPRRRRSQQE
jgi:hypothetical protein